MRVVIAMLLMLGMVQGGEYAVVTSSKTGLKPLDAALVRDIFLKERTFVDGVHILPINLSPTDEVRAAFEQRILQMDRDSLSEHWVVNHYQGVKPPLVQRSERGVKAFVINRPGAVGYIRKSRVGPELEVLHEF